MLTMSAYTANLAAVMTTKSQSHPGITGVSDLVVAERPICVVENSAYGRWLANDSPWAGEIVLRWTPSVGMAAALRAGQCDGLIDRDLLVDYHLADPRNCEMKKAGPKFWHQSLGVGVAPYAELTDFTHQLSLWIAGQKEEVAYAYTKLCVARYAHSLFLPYRWFCCRVASSQTWRRSTRLEMLAAEQDEGGG